MRYIQTIFKDRPNGPIHIIKGPYAASATVSASDEANLVETWCRHVYQDQAGLLPDQKTKYWIHGVSSNTVAPKSRKPPPDAGIWHSHPCVQYDSVLCLGCQEVLQIHTDYPGELAAMDNGVLYREFREAHRSDDYDGDFTAASELRLQLAVAEMERRLRECGFLSG